MNQYFSRREAIIAPMCDGSAFAKKFSGWHPFAATARVGPKGFDTIVQTPGVYMLRVTAAPSTDVSRIEQEYVTSAFFAALSESDVASERFFAELGFGEDWGYFNKKYALKRLMRLKRLQIKGDRLVCPVIYIGCANNLRRRMVELAWHGHTANHPVWALLYAKWELEVGLLATERGMQQQTERQLKGLYMQHHADQLPAFVDR